MIKGYNLLLKTAPSEFRAWEHLDLGDQNSISLIVELTRGRKNNKADIDEDGNTFDDKELRTKYKIYNFEKNVKWLKKSLSRHPGFAVDLTRLSSLESAETAELRQPNNGYEKWVSFVKEIKESGINVYPTIQVSVEEGDTEESYKENLISQFEKLIEFSDNVYYRCRIIDDPEFIFDIEILADRIMEYIEGGGQFVCVLDHEFIRPGTGILHALRTANYIAALRGLVNGMNYIVIGTSFPRDIEELGDPVDGSFRVEEYYLYQEILRQTNDQSNIYYGDYGSINPERFDGITRGWRPRIDYPDSRNRIFYHREKRSGPGVAYAPYYQRVARRIVSEPSFISDNIQNWGVDMIKRAATGNVPSSAPAFWTSVRMHIHIKQRLAMLG